MHSCLTGYAFTTVFGNIQVDITNAIASQKSNSEQAFFFGLIAFVTIFPIVFVLLAAPYKGTTVTVDGVFSLLLLMSTMHVGLTAFFYADSEYRAVVRAKWQYYIAFPVVMIVTAGLISSTFPVNGIIYVMMFYHAWLLFHYGRQNYGILAFAAAAGRTGRPHILAKAGLHLVPIGGILGSYSVLSQAQASLAGPHLGLIFNVGVVLTVIGIGCAVMAAILSYRQNKNIRHAFFMVLLSFFYVPTFFFDNYMQAIMGYAIAHALQYFIFMVFLAGGSKNHSSTQSFFVLFLAMICVWLIILLTREKNIWGDFQPFVAGAALGLIMWHFIMDAGFWKLSIPWQREQVQQRLGFIFTK